MIRYLVKRLISGFLAFLIFTAILFFGLNLLIPYDFVTTLSLFLPGEEVREALRAELGLNLPLWQQYLNWLGRLLQGDLGLQFSLGGEGTPVTSLVVEALPTTLLVFVTGAFVAFLLGQWLGKVAAWHPPKWLSGSVAFSSIAAYTAFPPWLAFLVGFVLIDRLEFLPISITSSGFRTRLWQTAETSPSQVMLDMVYSLLAMLFVLGILHWLVQRLWRRQIPLPLSIAVLAAGVYLIWLGGGYAIYAFDIMIVASVPFITFVLLGFGDTMLIMQTSMIDVRHETYIQLARAKGLPEKVVRNKHAGRNALLPALTRFVINLPYLLTAIVIVEHATGWPGIGMLLFNSIDNQNTFVYMGILVIVALIALVARLFLDVAYAYLDPRIRYGAETVAENG